MNEISLKSGRARVEHLQAVMSKLPQIELETRHYFADGMYCREVFCPAESTIVGKVHKCEHFFVILSGDVTLSDGITSTRHKAPHILVSAPGTKRAAYAHVDSICITFHKTDLKDLDEIERELVEEDSNALFDSRNQLKVLT